MRVNPSEHGIKMKPGISVEVSGVPYDDIGEMTKAMGLAVAADVDARVMQALKKSTGVPEGQMKHWVNEYTKGHITKEQLKRELHINPDSVLEIGENGTIRVIINDPKKPSFYLEEEQNEQI